ncbi:MAG: hypothetical protein IMX01_09840 [Limnochordaceae bacterium]|nr:hypothetical protein [Limnochordaceae bacterium]
MDNQEANGARPQSPGEGTPVTPGSSAPPSSPFSPPVTSGPTQAEREQPPLANGTHWLSQPDRAWGVLALVSGLVWLLLLTGGLRLEDGAIFFGLVTLVLLGLFLTKRADGLLVAATQTAALAVFIQLEPHMSRWNEDLVAPAFFASVGLGFVATYLLRPRSSSWAIYPAAALLGFAALLWVLISGQAQEYFLPIALIAAGIILVATSFRPRSHSRRHKNE